ncbi:hypothetical protein R6Q59_032664 [Mikania micrantha]
MGQITDTFQAFGEFEGSILGAEVEVARKTYSTQLARLDENGDDESVAKAKDGGLLKPHIFTLTIPQVDGSNLSINLRWSQKVICKHGEFILNVPYSFPEYVTPASKKHIKKEKIQLYVNCGLTAEVVCNLKERKREPGKLDLLYEAQALKMFSGTRKSIPMIYPSTIPDLCYDKPLIISGRYKGNFPEKLEARGILSDMSKFTIEAQQDLFNVCILEKTRTQLVHSQGQDLFNVCILEKTRTQLVHSQGQDLFNVCILEKTRTQLVHSQGEVKLTQNLERYLMMKISYYILPSYDQAEHQSTRRKLERDLYNELKKEAFLFSCIQQKATVQNNSKVMYNIYTYMTNRSGATYDTLRNTYLKIDGPDGSSKLLRYDTLRNTYLKIDGTDGSSKLLSRHQIESTRIGLEPDEFVIGN